MLIPKWNTLVVSDLHFGKITHFRKNGIGIPTHGIEDNWALLRSMLLNENIDEVIFLGDLFHAHINDECYAFFDLLTQFPSISFILIKGNHDILDESIYHTGGLQVYDVLKKGPFIFTHEPLEELTEAYCISGHIHPGVRMVGKGGQSVRLACFYFGEHQALLPAFGSFTGLKTIKPLENDRVFVCLPDEVIEVFA